MNTGTVYKKAKQAVIDSWETTFTFNTYRSGLGRADGISFIIQNKSVNAISAPVSFNRLRSS
jgi:hypothetical protein